MYLQSDLTNFNRERLKTAIMITSINLPSLCGGLRCVLHKKYR